MSSVIRYMYLRDESRSPVGCLAIKLHRKKGYLEYQVSVVNPIDRVHPLTGRSLPFNKTMARRLALGRLVEEGLRVTIFPDATMNEISMTVMLDLASLSNPTHQGDIPTRAIKAAKTWLKRQSKLENK